MTISPKTTHRWLIVLLFVAALAAPRSAPAAQYIFPTLGAGGNFAVFGLTGGSAYSIDNNGATINGNEGISSNGTITGDGTVNGSIFQFQAGQYQGTGIVTGNTTYTASQTAQVGLVNSDIMALVTGAVAIMASDDSTHAAYGSINGGQTTIDGSGVGVNVIDFTNITLGMGDNLTLQGNGTDYFVVRIAGTLSLTGTGSLLLSGIDRTHVIYDFTGGGTNSISLGSGGVINGTLIAPGLSFVTIGGTVNGQVIANGITLDSGAVINGAAPEPATLLLIGSALIGLAVFSKRVRRG